MMSKSFVVWGIPHWDSEEYPLYTKAKTYGDAKKAAMILESKFGCRSTRVQVIDDADPTCLSEAFRKVFTTSAN